ALEQREHVVLLHQLLADQLHRVLGRVEGRYVQQRDAELQRVGGGQLGRAHQLLLGDEARQRHLRFRRLGHGRTGGGLVKGAIQDQTTGNAGDTDKIGGG